MREETRKYHNDTLSYHQANMYETLIHPFNIITDTVKSFVFETEEGQELQPLRGFLALKEGAGRRDKFFIEEQFLDSLPIRVNKTEELFLKESSNRKSIILRPLDPTPFKIVPQQCFATTKEFVDGFVNFEHSNPIHWTLLKITAIMGYVGKTFTGNCSPSEFGKSSIYEVLHSLTGKSPVFQPRSIPGILVQITGDGNIVFDEVHQSNAEVKRCMENFTLQVAGNKPVYINGAAKTNHTKAKYDVSHQSITYLYNVITNYKTPNEEFFDHIFSNNQAIDSRLLKLKFDGKLTEKFDRDFDIISEAEKNKMFYMRIAKHLLHLKKMKLNNTYQRKYDYDSRIGLKGRRKQIYDEITWLIDSYAESLEEYQALIKEFDSCILNYQSMLKGEQPLTQNTFGTWEEKKPLIEEESVVEAVLEVISDNQVINDPIALLRSNKGVMDTQEFITIIGEAKYKDLLTRGEVYEPDTRTTRLLE